MTGNRWASRHRKSDWTGEWEKQSVYLGLVDESVFKSENVRREILRERDE